jgi:mannosyl-3-phosphoglycerate phosphatase
VKKKDLQISEGGRFYHLHGKNDKGYAVKKLISWYKESHSVFFTLALGDSPNDFSMLREVDIPVLVRSAYNFPGIDKEIPGVKITNEVGPEGWNSVIMEILMNKINGGVS